MKPKKNKFPAISKKDHNSFKTSRPFNTNQDLLKTNNDSTESNVSHLVSPPQLTPYQCCFEESSEEGDSEPPRLIPQEGYISPIPSVSCDSNHNSEHKEKDLLTELSETECKIVENSDKSEHFSCSTPIEHLQSSKKTFTSPKLNKGLKLSSKNKNSVKMVKANRFIRKNDFLNLKSSKSDKKQEPKTRKSANIEEYTKLIVKTTDVLVPDENCASKESNKKSNTCKCKAFAFLQPSPINICPECKQY